jgi:hypothetical protein
MDFFSSRELCASPSVRPRSKTSADDSLAPPLWLLRWYILVLVSRLPSRNVATTDLFVGMNPRPVTPLAIDGLHEDLLRLVFREYVAMYSPNVYTWIHITLVCRTWRVILLGMPDLFAVIASRQPIKQVPRLLVLSQTVPLRVDIYFTSRELRDLLVPHMSRVHTLRMRIHPPAQAAEYSLLFARTSPVPAQLESLDLDLGIAHPPTGATVNSVLEHPLPRLRMLVLHGHIDWAHPVFHAQIRTLRVSRSTHGALDVLPPFLTVRDALRAMPLLEELAVSFRYGFSGAGHDPREVHLPALASLDVELPGYDCAALCSGLVLPDAVRIKVKSYLQAPAIGETYKKLRQLARALAPAVQNTARHSAFTSLQLHSEGFALAPDPRLETNMPVCGTPFVHAPVQVFLDGSGHGLLPLEALAELWSDLKLRVLVAPRAVLHVHQWLDVFGHRMLRTLVSVEVSSLWAELTQALARDPVFLPELTRLVIYGEPVRTRFHSRLFPVLKETLGWGARLRWLHELWLEDHREAGLTRRVLLRLSGCAYRVQKFP